MNSLKEIEVNTARDALALLSRMIYKKYGDEVLPLIGEVCRRLGRAIGNQMRTNLDSFDLKSVGNAFFEGARRRKSSVTILEATEKKFRGKNERCALGLAGAGRPLCEAMMNMDKGIFEAATGEEIELSIVKTVAAGDECCDVMFALKG
ncbi:MAG: L-2-amino-thiazoline-4-carboxylic acid hydrolase [Desulfobacterales bacterium]|nr:L-2-amino-thiazoline-4-carboxylic acid hydrolase [Desulfobacterales bacterium]